MVLEIHSNWLRIISLLCTALLVPGDALLMAQQSTPPPASTGWAAEAAPKIPADQ